MAFDDRPSKRSASMNDFDLPIAKKSKLTASHRLRIDERSNNLESLDVAFNGDAQVELLLTRSIALALEALGFEASEPLALESFRLVVEEYMHDFLADVRQSMLACRRTKFIAPDFLQALHTHQLSLRALLPHLDPPVPRKKAQITLTYEPKQEEEQCDHRFLGADLNDTSDQRSRSYIPRHFPTLPSKHTYQATAEYPSREEDPRKIRERAAEEGRLAEEALRRLVSAKSSDRPPTLRGGRRGKSVREQRDDLWKETMQAVNSVATIERSEGADTMDLDYSRSELVMPGKTVTDNGRISSAVNAEKRYWRRVAPAQGSGQGGNDGVS
ncbi:MAG: hypothetical protein L6R42_000542 [Xanthoria sp. 1 TBL-2021]|nr:MAG: hypothetical protein L6R42_000542 [Xanthoria sp. 1 TBL-2021]